MSQTSNLSNRQQQIFDAVRKITEGEKLKNEGWLEFFQLTKEGGGKTQGGRNVTAKAQTIAKTVIIKKPIPIKVDNSVAVDAVLDLITKEGNNYLSVNRISKRLKMSWKTTRNIVDDLAKQGRVRRVNKTLPNGNMTECLVVD